MDDHQHWVANDVRRTPFTGTGSPEALTSQLAGYWSRRITD